MAFPIGIGIDRDFLLLWKVTRRFMLCEVCDVRSLQLRTSSKNKKHAKTNPFLFLFLFLF